MGFIMSQGEFELIRQAEKANFTKKQMEELQDWALESRVRNHILDDIFAGDMEVVNIEDGDILVQLTDQGVANSQEEEEDYEDWQDAYDDEEG